MSTDIEGNKLSVDDEVAFSMNLWRGRDIVVRGRIKTLAKESALVTVISKEPDKDKSPIGYGGWPKEKRAKYSKILLISIDGGH